MATKKVRIVFLRARPRLDSDVWASAEYPIGQVITAIAARSALEGDAKYVMTGGGPLLGMKVDSDESVSHLAIYRIRTDMLPEVELNGQISPLTLAKNAKLADPSHWIFFERNVVGTLATRDGPGKLQTSNYLQRVVEGRPTIELVPIVREDVLRQLSQSGSAKSGTLRVDASNLEVIAAASTSVQRAIRDLGGAVGAGSLEVIFRPPEGGAGVRQEFAELTKGLFRSIREAVSRNGAAGVRKLQLSVADEEAPNHVTTIDLLADDIALFREVDLVGQTRHVDPFAVQDAIIDAYNEALTEIDAATAGGD